MYQRGLKRTAIVAQHSLSIGMQKRRSGLWEEVTAHIALVSSAIVESVRIAGPLDLLVMLDLSVMRHFVRPLPDGTCSAAPSTVDAATSHVRQCYEDLVAAGLGSQTGSAAVRVTVMK